MKRRSFLSQTGKAFAGLSAAMASAKPQRVLGANDRITLAGIGIGGRGQSLLKGFLEWDEIDVSHLCEVNSNRGELDTMAEFIHTHRDHQPTITDDFRHALDAPEVDAVVIATVDHWHGPAMVWACQASKDVYVEKPVSHNIWEGRKMIEAASRYGRVVQCGTQNRSAAYNRSALEYIRSGALGSIHRCKVFNMKPGGPFTIGPNGTPPEGFNYDLWLGPAPERPYNPDVVSGWKMFWDYTAGDLADDGAHQLDLARMLIQKGHPSAVHSSGGNLAFDDDREVPDTLVTTYEYDDLVMTFELTQWTPYMTKTPFSIRDHDTFPHWPQNATRIELYGTKGLMIVGRHGGGWQVFHEDGEIVEEEFGRFPDDEHKKDFIACTKTRSQTNADIETGHISASLIHLASVSLRTGSRKLVFDPETETFVDDRDANALLKRTYRNPYEIPDVV